MKKYNYYITKSEIAKSLASQFKLPESTSENALNVILKTMINSLAYDNRVELRGFGSFEIRAKKTTQARNPKTGQRIQTPKLYRTHFKAGDPLKNKINALAKQKPLK